MKITSLEKYNPEKGKEQGGIYENMYKFLRKKENFSFLFIFIDKNACFSTVAGVYSKKER
ncbi:MAG: hypothetical protein IJW33_04200 [Lentisphaeria bacterium]|nr:hypothetical protein [Lentisphaeria bacterium]